MIAPPSPSSSQPTSTGSLRPVLSRLAAIGDDRELVVLAAAAGSRLVVDRRVSDGNDARLVAHIARDEPVVNAAIIGRLYLADDRRSSCRPVADDDFKPPVRVAPPVATAISGPVLCDRHGIRFKLAAVSSAEHGVPELRWLRLTPVGTIGPAACVSARQVVGALEDYEPVRTVTSAAIERHRRDPGISVAAVGLELRRLGASPIVLNRRLREAVLDASVRRGLSLSAIALACGRAKLDRRGRHSGETSWLARRVGLLPDDSGRRPNPWVHSDVLAVIARDGLGIAPHEVELG